MFQAVCRQYAHALNNCSAEKFLEIGVLYPEIAVQEKVVDFYVELLRKDQVLALIVLSVFFFLTLYVSHWFSWTKTSIWRAWRRLSVTSTIFMRPISKTLSTVSLC